MNPSKADQTSVNTAGPAKENKKTSISIEKPMDPDGPKISVTKSSSGDAETSCYQPRGNNHEDEEIKTSSSSGDNSTPLPPPGGKRTTIKLTNHSEMAAAPVAVVNDSSKAKQKFPNPPRNRNSSEASCQKEQESRISYRRDIPQPVTQAGHQPIKNNNARLSTGKGELSSSRKCLLIHDSTFEHFDSGKFSNQFDIKTYRVNKVRLAAKNRKLKETIEKENPECIYLHLGLHDIISDSVDSVLCSFEEIVEYLIKSTEASLCFSLVVPTSNCTSLNKKIEELNRELSLMITTARSDEPELRGRLFTYNNSSVAWLNSKLSDGVQLSERGKLVMYGKLKDGLRKTLRLPRTLKNNSFHE